MLQQTRVDQAEPYYRRFVERFPTIDDLARADLDDVLLCWEGLGYYSRARHLHEAAHSVVRKFGGEIPDDAVALRSLPGVGPYTAAAVLSIAFGRPHAALDGNVVRVLARVFRVEADAKKSSTRRVLSELADELLDPQRPGAFNQAVMEVGATVCRPRAPACDACPLQQVCEAREEGRPEAYPVTSKRPPVPHHNIAVGILFNENGDVLIQKRERNAMLGGLWEFPGGKQEPGESIHETCAREVAEEVGVSVDFPELFHKLSHTYSHLRITLHAFIARIAGREVTTESGVREWAAPSRLDEYAFPRANRRLIDRLMQEFGADFA